MKQPNRKNEAVYSGPKPPGEWRYEHITAPRRPWYESEAGKAAYYRMKLRNLYIGASFMDDYIVVSKLHKKRDDNYHSFLINGRWYRSLDTAVNAILQIVASSVHERAA